ncbi:hypothetical protein HK103_001608 [Boothiomyces macroporosus]|uniref:Transcription factor domain-containing protein n=1 Tax=Boothiomyces macroporosus TaxID=261099 RepID=A0AAD5UEB8_9FUNG|nr:hypothetical protein HK103_001608 [Boothiomyces macroporosus]
MEKVQQKLVDNIQIKNVPNVLGMVLLALCYFNYGNLDTGLLFFGYGVEMAKELKINTESGLEGLNLTLVIAEECRKLWWLIYGLDRTLSAVGKSRICDSDNAIYLPGTANAEFSSSGDDIRFFGMQAMSAKEWYTPIISTNISAVRELQITKLLGQAVKYRDIYSSKDTDESAVIRLKLCNSLFLWHYNTKVLQGALNTKDACSLQGYLKYHYSMLITRGPHCYESLKKHSHKFLAENRIKMENLGLVCREAKSIANLLLELTRTGIDELTSIFYFDYIFQASIPLLLNMDKPSVLNLVTTLNALISKYHLGYPILNFIVKHLNSNDVATILQEHEAYKFEEYLHTKNNSHSFINEFLIAEL